MTVELDHLESGEGVPLVLLHAFPVDATMWDGVRERLSERHRVVVPHLRGFGTSPRDDGVQPSVDAMADDVARLLDRLALDRPVLGGLSMGGYVTLAFLRRHPGRVRAVLLADTKATADSDEARANRERIATAVLGEQGTRVLVTSVLPGLLGPATAERRPAVVDHVRGLVERADPAAVAWAQRAMAARTNAYDVLGALDVPLLAVVGADDGLTPPAEAEAMAAAAPRGEARVLAGVGHLSATEDPDAFVAAVRDWLDRLA